MPQWQSVIKFNPRQSAFYILIENANFNATFKLSLTVSFNFNVPSPLNVMSNSGTIIFEHPDSTHLVVQFSGKWLLDADLPEPLQLLAECFQAAGLRQITLEAQSLEQWDSCLPTLVLKIIDQAQARGVDVDTTQLPEGVQGLLSLARAIPERTDARRSAKQISWVEVFGESLMLGIADAKALLTFIGEIILALLSLLRGQARFRRVDLWLCLQEAGSSALAIVTLISLLVGLILAFVGAVQLSMFGAQIFIADLVGLGTVREMGALMTAVIMSGRTGAAYAAQLGTMNVNSEIDALKTMGISPIEFLVLPRMLALILMMPLLCLYADFMGILGGAMVTISSFDVSWVQYLNETRKSVHLADFGIGLFKSLVFAILIALSGCLRGMQCGRSASAVGDAATSAVVNSIVYIVVADSIITLLCNRLGI